MPEFASFATPEQFGAVGNGSTNDLTAWQNAVNAANVVLCRRNGGVEYSFGGGTLNVPGERLILGPGKDGARITSGTINITGSRVKIVGFRGASIVCTTANVEHVTIDGCRANVSFTGGGCKQLCTKFGRGLMTLQGSNNSCFRDEAGSFRSSSNPSGHMLSNVAGFVLGGGGADVASGANHTIDNCVGVVDGATGERNVSFTHVTGGSSVYYGPARALRLGSPDPGTPAATYKNIVYVRDSRVTLESLVQLGTMHFDTLDDCVDIANGVLHAMHWSAPPRNHTLGNAVGAGGIIVSWEANTGWRASGSGTFSQIW